MQCWSVCAVLTNTLNKTGCLAQKVCYLVEFGPFYFVFSSAVKLLRAVTSAEQMFM